MASQLMARYRDNAEIYHSEALCRQKSLQLLDEVSLAESLLPLDDMVEVGYNKSAGFVWLRQKRKKKHKFECSLFSYDVEISQITAFVENRCMRKLTGVKTKELFIWVSISDIYINDPSSRKITFGNPTGISRSFPISAFELNDYGQKTKD